MKKIQRKDKNKRNKTKSQELTLKINKQIRINENLLLSMRWRILMLINSKKVYSNKSSLVDLCIKTLSKKRINKIIKLSRWEFRRNARAGLISGFKKAIW